MSQAAVTRPLPVPDGLVAVVKQDCPTCRLVAPVLSELRSGSSEQLSVVVTELGAHVF